MLLIEFDADGRIGNVMRTWPPDWVEDLAARGRPFILADELTLAQCMVADGRLALRPPCPAIVAVEGRNVTVTGLPDGSTLAASAGGVTAPIPVDGPDVAFIVDEAGAFRLTISPPWPFLEAHHDVSIADV